MQARGHIHSKPVISPKFCGKPWSMEINLILETKTDERDEAWEQAFMATLPHTQFTVLNPQAELGPDGWPYLMVSTEKGSEPAQQILTWLTERGIGLVINPQKGVPDFALTYGMIWNFRETGSFISPVTQERPGKIEYGEGQKIHAGAPSEEYLPKYVRRVLSEFLLQQGIMAPRILVASADEQNYDLIFSMESLGNPPSEEHQGILEALSWFLPGHYSLALMSEIGLPGFHSLN